MELPMVLVAAAGSPEAIWYFLLALVNLSFLFYFYVDYRQHRAISRPTRPKELSDMCTEEEYGKSRDYAVECSRFKLIHSLFNHVVGLALLFGGARPLVWDRCGQLLGRLGYADAEIRQSLLYQGAFWLLNLAIELPWSIYSTFWIEARHGFNKTTKGTFIMDMLKGMMLTVLIGTPLFSAMLWVIKWAGSQFVPYLTALALATQLVMIVIYPILIQPLFNKFTPLEDGDLKRSVEELAKRVAFPLKKILVVDGSKRSSHSNAYFFGLFKNKRIVIFDTLIQQMRTEEIVAVVGHELGHWAHNDMFWGLVMSQLNAIWTLYLLSLAIGYRPLYAAFGFTKTQPLVVGMDLFSHLMAPLSVLILLTMSWMSRRREFRADRYAIDLGYGQHLPQALTSLYKENKSLVYPDWLYSMLHYSHPPPTERLAAMRQYAAKAGKKAE